MSSSKFETLRTSKEDVDKDFNDMTCIFNNDEEEEDQNECDDSHLPVITETYMRSYRNFNSLTKVSNEPNKGKDNINYSTRDEGYRGNENKEDDLNVLTVELLSARHSLWGHRLWNASLYLANLFDANPNFCKGKNILELGAGAGVPSLICALQGARKVIITDYGTSVDNDLITVIQRNIDTLVIGKKAVQEGILYAKPHVWGYPVDGLVEPLDIFANHTLISASSKKKMNTKESDNVEGRKLEINNGTNHCLVLPIL